MYFYLFIVGMVFIPIFGYIIAKLRQRINYLTTISDLVEHSKDIIYYCEIRPKLSFRYLSPAANWIISGETIDRCKKNPYIIFERIHPEDLPVLMKKISGELDYSKPILQRWRNEAGDYLWFEEYATPIYENGSIVAIQGIIRNIDDKIQLQEELEYKVSHDSLTHLYNRGYFESMIDQFDQYEDVSIAILIIDLDELKLINDRYGHKMGDLLIMETADLIKRVSGDKAIAARIGGDEFALLLINCHPETVDEFTGCIQKELEILNNNGNRHFNVKLSVGYAFTYSSLGRMEKLFVEADQHMYQNKKRNKAKRLKEHSHVF